MPNGRQIRAIVLGVMITALSSPFLALPSAQQGSHPGWSVPPNSYWALGAYGYGRDGIPTPYSGRGITGLEIGASAARGSVLGFPASGVTLQSWMTGTDLTGVPTNASDIWGYTSPSGREYAIIGLTSGTAFVEITDPVNPSIVAVIPGPVSSWRDMAVYGEYAYSVNERSGGIQVIRLSRIDKGKVRVVRTVTDLGLSTAHNIFVNEQSGYAYVLGANLARGGLVAVDLSDPANPVLEPVAWNVTSVHDVQVVTYTKGRYKGREIAFAFTGPMGLHIIDVTDKSAPVTLSNLVYENATYGHSGWLSSDRKFLYLNDELDERFNGNVSSMTTYVIRVARLENPKLANRLIWDLPTIDHNSMVQGDKLFLSAYRGGMRVVDISSRRYPQPIGWFDTYPDNDATAFSGAWGIYAGFPSGIVIVSDIQRGLFVLRPK